MRNVLAQGRTLIQSGKLEEALQLYRDARQAESTIPILRKSLEFNIGYLERRIYGMSPAAGKKLVVGIVAPDRANMGLFRDAETLAWALAGSGDLTCSTLLVSANLYKNDYTRHPNQKYKVLNPIEPTASTQVSTITDWLSSIDVLIILEALNPTLLSVSHSVSHVRQILFIPNLEWAVLDPLKEDTRPWEQLLQNAGTSMITIARCPSIQRRLAQFRIPIVMLSWSIPDPVVRPRRTPPSTRNRINILFNGGNLGYRDRRGLDIVVEALRRLGPPPREVQLVIKCNKPHQSLDSLPHYPRLNVKIDTGFLPSRDQLLTYYDEADLVLYPSRFEGFGLSLLEALHRGCYVLATDGDPMTDLLPEECQRIAAQRCGMIRLAPAFEPDPQSLADGIRQLLLEPSDLDIDISECYRERQERFRREFCSLVRIVAR